MTRSPSLIDKDEGQGPFSQEAIPTERTDGVAGHLDTNGIIDMEPGETVDRGHLITWSDLDPFTQGYVEALFAGDIYHREGIMIYDKKLPFHTRGWAFSDLAPETLARIIADCSSFQNIASGLDQKTGAVEGGRFWIGRQGGLSGAFGAAFPPLTVLLGDDGKVRFA